PWRRRDGGPSDLLVDSGEELSAGWCRGRSSALLPLEGAVAWAPALAAARGECRGVVAAALPGQARTASRAARTSVARCCRSVTVSRRASSKRLRSAWTSDRSSLVKSRRASASPAALLRRSASTSLRLLRAAVSRSLVWERDWTRSSYRCWCAAASPIPKARIASAVKLLQ